MKNIKFLVLLYFVAGLAGVFTCAFSASAHSGDRHADTDLTVTASGVTDDLTLENFVKHAAAHLQETETFGEATRLLHEFRNPEGDWNDGSTYLVLLTSRGGVYIHAGERGLEDQDWSDLADVSGKNVGELFLDSETDSVEYRGAGGTPKSAYSFPFSARSVPLSDPFAPERQGFVLIGGFDYAPPVLSDKISYEQLADSYNLRSLSPTLEAGDIVTRENLKQFVEEAILFFTQALVGGGEGNVATAGGGAGGDIDVVVLRRIFRLEGGPWKDGSTYIYITESEGNVIFNGANRNLEQTNILDGAADDPKLLEALQALIDAGKEGGGFVEYNWDDPDVEGDEPEGGGPGGTSPKLGYAKALHINKDDTGADPIYYIFGSGIYLGGQSGEPESGDGCAISAHDGRASQNFLLNLVLVLSCVFPFVLARRRSNGAVH